MTTVCFSWDAFHELEHQFWELLDDREFGNDSNWDESRIAARRNSEIRRDQIFLQLFVIGTAKNYKWLWRDSMGNGMITQHRFGCTYAVNMNNRVPPRIHAISRFRHSSTVFYNPSTWWKSLAYTPRYFHRLTLYPLGMAISIFSWIIIHVRPESCIQRKLRFQMQLSLHWIFKLQFNSIQPASLTDNTDSLERLLLSPIVVITWLRLSPLSFPSVSFSCVSCSVFVLFDRMTWPSSILVSLSPLCCGWPRSLCSSL